MGIEMSAEFKLVSTKTPKGDQPKAIKKLVDGYGQYERQTLLGITGSGKTFTMANVIQELGKPTLVLVHNKTLAFQLKGRQKLFAVIATGPAPTDHWIGFVRFVNRSADQISILICFEV